MKNKAFTVLLCAMAAVVAACSGGDPVARTEGTDNTGGCNGGCGGPTTSLTIVDVQQVIAQAVAEAQARGVNATIAVVDRVGNVLALYRMGNPAGRFVSSWVVRASALGSRRACAGNAAHDSSNHPRDRARERDVLESTMRV